MSKLRGRFLQLFKRDKFLTFVQTLVCLSVHLLALYRNHTIQIQVKTTEGDHETSCINESISFQGPRYLCWTVSWQWQKKSGLMDIGQSVQISAGSWIVHMARPEIQVERPKKKLPVARVRFPTLEGLCKTLWLWGIAWFSLCHFFRPAVHYLPRWLAWPHFWSWT